MILEACVENISEALRAEELGAGRIELCENLAEGGTTPSIGTILTCKRLLKIPVMVMIRPRGGNFVYSAEEVAVMIEDIKACLRTGADGIVTGVLNPADEIDLQVLKEILQHAGEMQVTFHKAIDDTPDILAALEKLFHAGIHRVLTSGGKSTAKEGSRQLNEMIRRSAGKLKIIAAGKITAENLASLSSCIMTDEFHGRRIVGKLS
jgi:copper homeostasis protein